MDITTFFEQSIGKWVSQRTSHLLIQNQSENVRSDVMVEALLKDDPAVVQLCQQQGVNPALVAGGMKLSWKSIVAHDPSPQTGSSLLVAIPDAGQPQQGQILSQVKIGQAVTGRYSLGEDDVLTLTTEAGDISTEEQIWFAGPNVRLRSSVVKHRGNCQIASFHSEIRLGGAPAAAQSATAEVTR
jgi:CpeS-like protein